LAIADYTTRHPVPKVELLPLGIGASSDWVDVLANVTAHKVVGVVGPSTARAYTDTYPIFEGAGIPSITPLVSDPQVEGSNWRHWHRLIADDYQRLSGLADYLSRVYPIRRGYTIDYGDGTTANFAGRLASRLKQDGAVEVVQDRIARGGGDIPAIVARIRDWHPDVIVQYGTAEDIAELLKQLRQAGVTAPFATSDLGVDSDFLRGAGTRAEGAVVASSCIDVASTSNEAINAFVQRYRDRYGSTPGLCAAEAYDATTAFLKAIEAGRTTPAAINDFLSTVRFPGLSRTVAFQPDGEGAASPVYVYKVHDGTLTALGDTSTAQR